jgi:hypothetical protein
MRDRATGIIGWLIAGRPLREELSTESRQKYATLCYGPPATVRLQSVTVLSLSVEAAMGVDGPDDFDVSAFGESSDDSAGGRARVAVEERDRFEYWADLRAAVAADAWEAAAERFRGLWASHCERWPWNGSLPDNGRFLDAAADAEVEKRCETIAEIERDVVSPAMRDIEACDPDRRLVGFEHRLKGLDRIKDKVASQLHDQPGMSNEEAVATVKDALRFTFCYSEDRYVSGSRADCHRLESRGFILTERRNTWSDSEYRGVNSRWTEPETGITFEVQFHTESSFETKQLTHVAYERVRDPSTTAQERRELRDLQRAVVGQVAVPPGAERIPDYP